MNDIEHYLDQACRRINRPEELRQHLRQELREHLDEAIESSVAEGASREEATRQAIESLGEPETIRDGMESVYGPGITSLFVDKAIQWRDRKWHIATQVGLALIVATALGCTAFVMMVIAPKLLVMHQHLGVDVPPYLGAAIDFARLIGGNVWIWLALLIGGWGLFEWKCRSDHNAHVRTAIGVSLALLSILVAFWIMGAITVSLTQLSVQALSGG